MKTTKTPTPTRLQPLRGRSSTSLIAQSKFGDGNLDRWLWRFVASQARPSEQFARVFVGLSARGLGARRLSLLGSLDTPDPLANHTPLNARGSGVSRLTARRPPKPRALSPTNTLANCSEGLACEARRFEVCAKAYGWDADARRAHLPEGPRLGSVRALRGARN